jgi:hypothetical protein
MPAKWQQWMPFKIEKFWSSPSVQAMSHAAQIGYLRLLGCQWQSIDGAVSPDPFDLAEQSGLGDEAWTVHGPRILRKFITLKDGRLRNLPNYEDWCEAKRIFEARKSAALNTVRTRSPKGYRTVTIPNVNGHRTVTDQSPLCSADTITGTVTNTSTEEQKQKPSRGKREDTKTAIRKTRHDEFKTAIEEYWKAKNPGIEMPWAQPEGKNLEMWLKASPNTSIEQFKVFLRNRYKSAVNHTDRPSRWIGNVTSFAGGPIDSFGKPTNGSNGHGNISTIRREQREAAFAEAQRILDSGELDTIS